MTATPIRMVTWLAPGLAPPLFEYIRADLERTLQTPTTLAFRTKLSGPVFGSCDPFGDNRADLGFLCAPASVPAAVRTAGGFELLELAPVFDDDRYGGFPTCFCDLMVRENSPYRDLQSLRGATFGYNDRVSLSGWLGVASRLRQNGVLVEDFFGKVLHTGGHLQSLTALERGEIDVASIDSNVLCTNPGIAEGLRRADTIGPWPSQPVVVRTGLQSERKRAIREALLSCGPYLDVGFIGFALQPEAALERVPSGPNLSDGVPSLDTDSAEL